MEDARQPFDLRRNEDAIFSPAPWWMSNYAMTWGSLIVLVIGVLMIYAGLVLGMVRVAQAWVER